MPDVRRCFPHLCAPGRVDVKVRCDKAHWWHIAIFRIALFTAIWRMHYLPFNQQNWLGHALNALVRCASGHPNMALIVNNIATSIDIVL